jgi:hypothetical protein
MVLSFAIHINQRIKEACQLAGQLTGFNQTTKPSTSILWEVLQLPEPGVYPG